MTEKTKKGRRGGAKIESSGSTTQGIAHRNRPTEEPRQPTGHGDGPTGEGRQEWADKSGADSLPSESGEGQVPAHADRPPNRPKRTDACGAPVPASAHRNPIRERAPDNRNGCTALSVKAKFVRRLPPSSRWRRASVLQRPWHVLRGRPAARGCGEPAA